MREIRESFIERLGGLGPLKELYENIQVAWTSSGLYYKNNRLRDGRGLTELRHDHVNRALQDVCNKLPASFPAFDYDRRRSRAFALIEKTGLLLTAAIVANRNVWVAAAQDRAWRGRQTTFFSQPACEGDPIVALLMVINGRPTPLRIRERPRGVLVRFLDAEGYHSDEIGLDELFSNTRRVRTTLHHAIRATTPKRGVEREQISKEKVARLKKSLMPFEEGNTE